MYIATSELSKVARDFISTVLIPKAPTQTIKFTLGFILPYIEGAVENKINQLIPLAQSLEIINDSKKLDIDKAFISAQTALQNAGGTLTLYGYSANADDLRALKELAERYGTNE